MITGNDVLAIGGRDGIVRVHEDETAHRALFPVLYSESQFIQNSLGQLRIIILAFRCQNNIIIF